MNYPQANIFFQTILSNSPLRRSIVNNVIILFSLLFYTASSCVHTLNITLGCVLEVYRVKSVTNAKEGRGAGDWDVSSTSDTYITRTFVYPKTFVI